MSDLSESHFGNTPNYESATLVGFNANKVKDFDGSVFLPHLQIQDPSVSEGVHVVKFQGHHVIPKSIFRSSDFFIELKSAGLWNGIDFKLNGIPLPTSAGDILGITQHTGGHSGYDIFMREIIGAYDQALAKNTVTVA